MRNYYSAINVFLNIYTNLIYDKKIIINLLGLQILFLKFYNIFVEPKIV